VIRRGDGFVDGSAKLRQQLEGRYHHWDSYPDRLDATRWDLYHGHFQRDLNRMLLLDGPEPDGDDQVPESHGTMQALAE